MPAAAVSTVPPEEQLAWEAKHRARAAAAALAAAVLSVGGDAFSQTSTADAPPALLLDALRKLERPGPIGSLPSDRTPLFEFFRDHAASLIIAAILLGLAAVAAGFTLAFLSRAARHRSDRFPGFAIHLPLLGAVAILFGSVLTAVATIAWVNDLLDTSRTVDAVDVARPLGLTIGQIVVQLGGLLLAGSYVLASLHGMRTGLLTRTWGILGIFAGFMVVLPISVFSQILQPAWLVAFALVALGRWPGGQPAAWKTGQAEPWPSSAQLREERMKARGKPLAEPDPEPVEERAARVHPSSKKRKRKRRS